MPLVIIVCKHCSHSLATMRIDLPDKCPVCYRPALWKVAGSDELTPGDLKFLKWIRVKW